MNDSLVSMSDSDTEETKDRGSGSASSRSSSNVAAPAESAEAKPSLKQADAPAGAPKPGFKKENQFAFYYRQLEKIHNSEIDIKNVAPEEIMKMLIAKGKDLRRDS